MVIKWYSQHAVIIRFCHSLVLSSRDSYGRKLELLFSRISSQVYIRRLHLDFTASSRGPWASSTCPGLSSRSSSLMRLRVRACSLGLPARPRRPCRVLHLWSISKASRHRRNLPPTTRSSVSRWWTSCSSITSLWHRYRLLRDQLVRDKLPVG